MEAVSASFTEAQRYAMDPMDLAGAVLDAVRENRAYIIGHPEFAAELDELHQELMGAIRRDLPLHPKRAEFEQGRHDLIRSIKSQMEAW